MPGATHAAGSGSARHSEIDDDVVVGAGDADLGCAVAIEIGDGRWAALVPGAVVEGQVDLHRRPGHHERGAVVVEEVDHAGADDDDLALVVGVEVADRGEPVAREAGRLTGGAGDRGGERERPADVAVRAVQRPAREQLELAVEVDVGRHRDRAHEAVGADAGGAGPLVRPVGAVEHDAALDHLGRAVGVEVRDRRLGAGQVLAGARVVRLVPLDAAVALERDRAAGAQGRDQIDRAITIEVAGRQPARAVEPHAGDPDVGLDLGGADREVLGQHPRLAAAGDHPQHAARVAAPAGHAGGARGAGLEAIRDEREVRDVVEIDRAVPVIVGQVHDHRRAHHVVELGVLRPRRRLGPRALDLGVELAGRLERTARRARVAPRIHAGRVGAHPRIHPGAGAGPTRDLDDDDHEQAPPCLGHRVACSRKAANPDLAAGHADRIPLMVTVDAGESRLGTSDPAQRSASQIAGARSAHGAVRAPWGSTTAHVGPLPRSGSLTCQGNTWGQLVVEVQRSPV